MNYKENIVKMLDKIDNPMFLRCIYIFLEELNKDTAKES